MSASSYENTLREERRGCILKLLQVPPVDRRRGIMLGLLGSQPDFALSESALKQGLALRDVRASYDLVRDDLTWLQSAALVRVSEAVPGLWLVTLTRAGEDWCEGSREVPQVSRDTRTEAELQESLATYGLSTSIELLRVDLAWLREHALIKTEVDAHGTWSARTTTRGTDCAEGRMRIPGIARPRAE